jgi:hypothetical protein
MLNINTYHRDNPCMNQIVYLKSARQIYRPDSVNPLAGVGNHSSGHFIAEML